MKILRSIAALRKFRQQLGVGASLGFVPTMGALHSGHASLIQRSTQDHQDTVVSIFVNPSQFGPQEDLSRYPRPLEDDLKLLKKLKVSAVFLPTASEIYPENFQTWISVDGLAQGLCGSSRPGHFRGVATIVYLLLQWVQPQSAYFGQKDYQQLAIIRQMTRDLQLPIKIIGCPIVRDDDGLALSSRNQYLSSGDRKLALGLSQTLHRAKLELKDRPKIPLLTLADALCAALPQHKNFRLDYLAWRHADTLQPLTHYVPRKTLLAIAAFVGKTRLIDNQVY